MKDRNRNIGHPLSHQSYKNFKFDPIVECEHTTRTTVIEKNMIAIT
jgi:hypothetical protein